MSIKPTLLLCMTPGIGLLQWRQGGILNRELRPYREYVRRGWRVIIATYDIQSSVPPLPDGIEAECISEAPGKFYVGKWLNDPVKKADVVKTNQSKGSWAYVRAAHREGKPIVLRCGWLPGFTMGYRGTGALRLWYYRMYEGWAFRNADACEVPTIEYREWVRKRYRVSRDRIHVSPNWVDLGMFRPLAGYSRERSAVYVGRLDKVKRVDMLIRACSLARVSMTIVGSGGEESSLRSLANECGAEVEFLGTKSQEELPLILNSAQVFALTSAVEDHPKVMIEAMSCGMACVGTRVPGIENLIQHGVTGWLCESTPAAVAEGISRLMGDASLRRKLGENARGYAEANFDFNRIIDAEMRLVESLRSNERYC